MKVYDDLGHEIAKVAHELYEKSGRIHGRDLENWLEAERIVMQRYKEKELTAEKPMETVAEKKMPAELLHQAEKAASKEVEKEAPKKRTSAKKTTKKAEAKKEETKKVTKPKKTKK